MNHLIQGSKSDDKLLSSSVTGILIEDAAMKNGIKISLSYLIVFILNNSSYAETCPLVNQLTQEVPPSAPPGWTVLNFLTPAVFPSPPLSATSFPGQNYYFISAIHSFNPTFYNLRILCYYGCTANSIGCSPLTLVSNTKYREPTSTLSPWNAPYNLINTLVCMPKSNNPFECVFNY